MFFQKIKLIAAIIFFVVLVAPAVYTQVPDKPATPNISDPIPTYLPYTKIVEKLKEWRSQGKWLTEIDTYGASTQGKPLYYLRVSNMMIEPENKKVVLLHACIHGNEPLATGVAMGWIGKLLASYGKEERAAQLLDSRDIYFIPVLSPDSYPSSRIVDGVDANREYPCPAFPNHKSIKPVKAIQDLFIKVKPSVAISCHTSGRVFLIPWGDTNDNCKDIDFYKTLVKGKMGQSANFGYMRACDMYSQMYGRPIHGGELDWYYRQGAMSLVVELGTHQHIPTHEEIKSEINRTYDAFLLFIKEAGDYIRK